MPPFLPSTYSGSLFCPPQTWICPVQMKGISGLLSPDSCHLSPGHPAELPKGTLIGFPHKFLSSAAWRGSGRWSELGKGLLLECLVQMPLWGSALGFLPFFSVQKNVTCGQVVLHREKTKACLCCVLEITHSGFLVLQGVFLSELRRVCVCLRKEKHGISLFFALYCGQFLFILRVGPLGADSWGTAQSITLKFHNF